MNLYRLVTWIAVPLLGLGSIAVFSVFLYHLVTHRNGYTDSDQKKEG